MSDPWLSIITVNRNNVQGLQRTLKSTTEQTFANFEQIVVDGGSSDGSRELLSDPAYRVSRWVSEPDRGIYHAMNKGIEMSRGRFVLFPNSGDHFIDTNSLQLAQTACSDVDINYFDVQF